MKSILGILLLAIGTFAGTALLLKKDLFHRDIEASIVETLWQKDIDLLLQKNQLPKSWAQIRELRITALSPRAARWLRHANVPVHLNPKGLYQLEVSVDHNEEPDSIAIITTYSLIDLKSKNTLWEFGRTYSIENKKWLNLAEQWIAYGKILFPESKKLSSIAPEELATEELNATESDLQTPEESSTTNSKTE